MNGDIEYFADTLLLEKMFTIAYLVDENKTITKQAFDLSSFLNPIKSAVVSGVGSQIHPDAPISSVINVLAPAVLFKLHPAIGLIAGVAEAFGFDFVSMFTKVADMVKKAILSGQQVTAQTINQMAVSVSPGLGATASDDLFIGLRQLEKTKGLFKAAATSYDPDSMQSLINSLTSFKSQPQQMSPLLRMFSFMGPVNKGKFFLGFISWLIKTVLLSAGLLAVGSALKGIVSPTKPETKEEPQQQPNQQQPNQPTQISQNPNVPNPIPKPEIKEPRPSGAGSNPMRSNPSENWIVKLNGQKPSDVVLEWTMQSYPDLEQYKDIVKSSPAFWAAVRRVTKNWPVNQSSLVIPQEFNKIDDILNLFIHDIYKQINQQESI